MRAAQWDTSAEIGGGWRVVLRRTAEGVPLPLAQPCTMELWARGADPVTASPLKTITATLSTDTKAASLGLSVAEVTALGVGRFEHRIVMTDPGGDRRVMVRGYLHVRGRRGDL